MVVIAIIGLLSSVVLASLDSARSKARDAKRIADIRQLQTALELYRSEHGKYPLSGSCGSNIPNTGWCNSIQSMQNGHWVRQGNNNLEGLIDDPIDPKQLSSPKWAPVNGGTYFYFSNGYGGPGEWYMIIFGLENNHSIMDIDGVTACNGTRFHYGTATNRVITLGASCGSIN